MFLETAPERGRAFRGGLGGLMTSGLRRHEDVHYADRTSWKLLAGPSTDCRDVRLAGADFICPAADKWAPATTKSRFSFSSHPLPKALSGKKGIRKHKMLTEQNTAALRRERHYQA